MLASPGRGLWLGFKETRACLWAGSRVSAALAPRAGSLLEHCTPAFPHHTASIALATKLFQQLGYCWSQASVLHTEDLFREASVGNSGFGALFAAQVLPLINWQGPSLDSSPKQPWDHIGLPPSFPGDGQTCKSIKVGGGRQCVQEREKQNQKPPLAEPQKTPTAPPSIKGTRTNRLLFLLFSPAISLSLSFEITSLSF